MGIILPAYSPVVSPVFFEDSLALALWALVHGAGNGPGPVGPERWGSGMRWGQAIRLGPGMK